MCLVPRSEAFDCQGQRSRSPQTKNMLCTPITPTVTEWNALAENNVMQQQMVPFRCCQGMILVASMQFMFGKTSLVLVHSE